MTPKNKVIKPVMLILSFFNDFPAVNKLKKAVVRIVIGIKNSMKIGFTTTIPKTESKSDKVCPSVKTETKTKTLFQSLNAYGTVNAIKKSIWS